MKSTEGMEMLNKQSEKTFEKVNFEKYLKLLHERATGVSENGEKKKKKVSWYVNMSRVFEENKINIAGTE